MANGEPAIGKTYSDTDLLLVRTAVLAACDGLDGLADGIVDNQPARTSALAGPKLSDALARFLDNKITAEIGQTIVIDNKGPNLNYNLERDLVAIGQAVITPSVISTALARHEPLHFAGRATGVGEQVSIAQVGNFHLVDACSALAGTVGRDLSVV